MKIELIGGPADGMIVDVPNTFFPHYTVPCVIRKLTAIDDKILDGSVDTHIGEYRYKIRPGEDLMSGIDVTHIARYDYQKGWK